MTQRESSSPKLRALMRSSRLLSGHVHVAGSFVLIPPHPYTPAPPPPFFLFVRGPPLRVPQASDFATLAKASKAVPIMDEEPPEGCAVHIIDDQSQVRVVHVCVCVCACGCVCVRARPRVCDCPC